MRPVFFVLAVFCLCYLVSAASSGVSKSPSYYSDILAQISNTVLCDEGPFSPELVAHSAKKGITVGALEGKYRIPASTREGWYIQVYKQHGKNQPQKLYLFWNGKLVTKDMLVGPNKKKAPFSFPVYASTGLRDGQKIMSGDYKTPIGTFCLGTPTKLKYPRDKVWTKDYGSGYYPIGSWGDVWLDSGRVINGIYLHGTPGAARIAKLGQPASGGCIRVENEVISWMLTNVIPTKKNPIPITIYNEQTPHPRITESAKS